MARGQAAHPRKDVKRFSVLTREAEADLADAFAWYEQQASRLGHEFLEVTEDLFLRIAENPWLYQEVDYGVRRALTQRFPYAVYYLPEDETVVVLAILHQARDPDHWTRRL